MKPNCWLLGLAVTLLWPVVGLVGLAQGQSPYPHASPPAFQPSAPTAPSAPIAPPRPFEVEMPSKTLSRPATIELTSAQEDALSEAGLGQSNDNPTGRQEPAVSIEWIGPPATKVGQPVSFQIIVKNISVHVVQQVVVRSKIPDGVKVNVTEPKGATEDGATVWKLGDLQPRQEARIDLQLVAETTGTLFTRATVSFAADFAARLQVYQPKLVLKATAPDKVVVGDPAPVTLTVSNPGDAVAEHVKVIANLSDGLEHARGKSIDFDLGNLGPKETRSVQVLCAAKSAGPQSCDAVATAEPGLSAEESAKVEVLIPRLELAVTAPALRYLDRHAVLTFKVTNPGTATANNVTVMDQVPSGFKFVSATADGRHDFVSRTVYWSLGDLPAGGEQDVSVELMAINPGEQKNKIAVTAARGLKVESEAVTRVEGLPALLMEVADLDDPVEVGAETSYEVRVTNTGTKTETNLQLTCTVPDKMQFLGAKGAAGLPFKVEGQEVVFEALPKLAPRADAIYRIRVKGTAPGDLRFRARIKADGLSEPVLKEESTKVYGDDVAK